MKALVLSGGSIKGAFQAGAIHEVLKQGYLPEHIYGVSIGAMNGAFLADRAGASNPPDWPAIGDQLVNFRKNRITSFEDLGSERGGLKLVLSILRNKFKGLLKMKKADRLIEETVDFENIKRFGNFFVGFVNLKSGDFTLGHTDDGEDRFFERLIASTHEPIIKNIIWSQAGEPLVDGGLRNIAPLKSAIDAGASEIIVIANQAQAIKDPKPKANYRKLTTLAKRTISVMTNEIINNDLKLAHYINAYCLEHGDQDNDFLVTAGPGEEPGPHEGHRCVKIRVIRPRDPLPFGVIDFTPADIKAMIKLGRERAKEVLKDQEGFLDFD